MDGCPSQDSPQRDEKKFHDYYVGIVLPVESHSSEADDYAGKPSVI